MALIKCPECEKEVSTQAKVCPNCGYRLKEWKIEEFGRKLYQKRRLAAVVCGAIVVAVVAMLLYANTLTPYEKLAVENCNTLKGMLKSPDSFKLNDDILVYEDSDYGTIMFIPYSGANSYGADIRSVAQFSNGTDYAGDYDELDRDDFYTDKEYNDYLLIGFPYAYALAVGDDEFSEFTHIDANKIMHKID